NVVGLYRADRRYCLNGAATARILDDIKRIVPHPQPRTVFLVDGMGELRAGLDEAIRGRVLIFGFPEGVQLWFDDATLDVMTGAQAPPEDTGRPLVRLRWDPQRDGFQRLP